MLSASPDTRPQETPTPPSPVRAAVSTTPPATSATVAAPTTPPNHGLGRVAELVPSDPCPAWVGGVLSRWRVFHLVLLELVLHSSHEIDSRHVGELHQVQEDVGHLLP